MVSWSSLPSFYRHLPVFSESGVGGYIECPWFPGSLVCSGGVGMPSCARLGCEDLSPAGSFPLILTFWWYLCGSARLKISDLQMVKKNVRKAHRRGFLSGKGRSQWDSMEEFEIDLKDWQEITNTCLIKGGRKTAMAYNSARGYDAGHGSFLDPSKSQIAHQTWRCVHYGVQSATSMVAELQPPSKRRKIRVPYRGCKFKVYAKFIPFLNKVRCTVTPHVGKRATEMSTITSSKNLSSECTSKTENCYRKKRKKN